jgi:virulence-associated protein VagC
MRLKVTDAGVVVPREMFPDVEEVDVRVEGCHVILTPLEDMNDPVWQLGNDPVSCALPDASENHDRYLYQTDLSDVAP